MFFAKSDYLPFGKQMPFEAGFVASDGIAATRRRGGCFFPHASDYGVSGGLFRKKNSDKKP
ncbi:hypothetical protein AB9R17_03170 [Neisseria gonorrhoeae]